MSMIRLWIAAAVLVLAGRVYAQETPAVTPSAEIIVPYAPPLSLPPQARLTGIRPVYQNYNRCSAAALTMQLSFFGWQGSYTDTIRALNPNEEDVAVRLDEMLAFAQEQGLTGIYRNGGTLDLLKALVAGGFPVLMENVYYDGPGAFNDWMAHNRIVMGYDDAKGEIYTFDSLLGNGPDNAGRPIPYADIDSRWRPFNRDFLVLYKPEDQAKIQQILGGYWENSYANEIALLQSQAELDSGASDSFTLFNQGTSLVELGRHEEAADAFDKARGIGLPWRMLWYQYGPFEAYYHVGRYDDVLTLAREVLATTPGVEETYYYAGLAYEAKGDVERAKSNFQVALWRNADFTAARAELDRIGG